MSYYDDIDAYMVVIGSGASDLVPTDSSNFKWSSINQDNGGGGDGVMSTISPNIQVGSGGNIMEILSKNGLSVEKLNSTLDDKLSSISKTLSESGVKIEGIDKVEEQIKGLKDTYLEKASKFEKAFIDKDMSPKIDNKINVDTSTIGSAIETIADANKTISEGVSSQIETNTKIVDNLEKKNEHLDFLKGVNSTLKDSQGNKVVPREIRALKDSEFHHDMKTMNTADISTFVDGLGVGLSEFDEDDESSLKSLLDALKSFSLTSIDSSDNRLLFKKEV